MIRNVVFDFGGVLVFWEPLDFYKRILPEQEASDFVNFMMPYNLLLDAGIDKPILLDALKAKYTKWADYIDMWDKNWEDFFTHENTEAVEVIKSLHSAGVQLYGITNWQADKEYYLHDKLNFMPYLKSVLVSGKEKIIKPDIRIYNKLAEKNNLIPSQTLFIDDVLDNVIGAEKAGWVGHQFKDTNTLKQELKRLNLI